MHLNNAGAGLLAQPTLDAWNAAFYSVPLRRGDRILTGRAEYGSNVLAYLHVAQRTGAEVVVVPNDEHGQLDAVALAGLIDARTRLIGVSHVPTSGGLINPAAEIGRIARRSGVLFLLDATQSVGQFPVDVEAIGCDLLTATGRKFLRGPRGTGFLWVRRNALERLDPFVAEIQSATWDGARGLRTIALGSCLRDQLDALPGVRTHDLGVHRCAIVTAQVNGRTAAEVAAALARAHINVTTTTPEHTQLMLRFATCIRSCGSRPTTTTPKPNRTAPPSASPHSRAEVTVCAAPLAACSSGAIVIAGMNHDPDSLPSEQGEHLPATRRPRPRLIASVIVGGLALAFALVNLSTVHVDWIVGSAHSPLILVIAVSVLIGVGLDRVLARRARKRKSPDA